MQIAQCWLTTNQHGSNVRVQNVTPAEVYLIDQLRKRGSDDTESKISHITLTGEGKWDNRSEKQRLLQKYPQKDPKTDRYEVEGVWPGVAPQFPQTFEAMGYEVTNTNPKSGKMFPYPSKGEFEHKADVKYEIEPVSQPIEA